MAAGMALPAVNLGFNGYLLPYGKVRHILPHFGNLAGHLMSLGHRVGGKGMFPVIHMDIGTTDSDIHNFYQHLALFRVRNRHHMKYNLSRLCHNLLQHRRILTFPNHSYSLICSYIKYKTLYPAMQHPY